MASLRHDPSTVHGPLIASLDFGTLSLRSLDFFSESKGPPPLLVAATSPVPMESLALQGCQSWGLLAMIHRHCPKISDFPFAAGAFSPHEPAAVSS